MYALAALTGAQGQTAAPIGREKSLSGYEHLEDGEEFNISIQDLLHRGEALFRAQWTSQEGGVLHGGQSTKVAAHGGIVIADNNSSRTGEATAKDTRLPYWMPPDVGTDANDFHQKYGLDALAKALSG